MYRVRVVDKLLKQRLGTVHMPQCVSARCVLAHFGQALHGNGARPKQHLVADGQTSGRPLLPLLTVTSLIVCSVLLEEQIFIMLKLNVIEPLVSNRPTT